MTDEDLTFQILDINEFHDDNDEYKIRLFGKTKTDESVYVEVVGFRPYFFVEIPENLNAWHIRNILSHVKDKVWPPELAEHLVNHEVVKKCKFYYFTNYKKFTFLKLEFRNYKAMMAYARQFQKKMFINGVTRKKKEKFNLYETNIPPFLRFLHERNISAVGLCKIQKKNIVPFSDYMKPSLTNISCRVRWNDIERIESSEIHRFSILSFDLECTSLDGGFPQASRKEDEIIQIGLTYSRCGEVDCYKKTILCLKETSKIQEGEVISFKKEADMLLAFSKIIRETDPDIITGYNIYGFDFPYLEKRAELLGITTKFSRLSRLKNHICEFVVKDLSSSALGHNKISYYDIPGRVSIDLMKVVQRDHKLPLYKLDSVASHFIREKISNYTNEKTYTRLFVNSFYGITEGQYVNICYNDQITDNKLVDKKYKVIKIGVYLDDSGKNVKYIDVDDPTIDGKQYLGGKYKLFICQAKDDVSPADIFEFYKGTPDQRAIIAKYCLKDCELCNMLMAKLAIIINNIGMASVCNVPLSFIFLRGQGIKLFSLVSKACRENDHLIPVIKKKFTKEDELKKLESMTAEEKKYYNQINKYAKYGKDNDDDSSDEEVDETYEGAKVFKPEKPRAFFDPIPVLDYNSLYPNAMRKGGLSHERLVKDEKYMNHPEYKYNHVKYLNGKNEEITDIFAIRLDGKEGIIPTILKFLLDTRNVYKGKQANETDPFMASVYEGLQNAYKVTANSLYGQTGAPTSPIYLKEIAASTTAIGREMLQFAKDFVEGPYAQILQTANSKKTKPFIKCITEIYKNIPDENILNVKKNKGQSLWKTRDEFYKWVKEQIYLHLKGYTTEPKIIYGDTDSVFFRLNIRDKKTKELQCNKLALVKAINMASLCEVLINLQLGQPMYLEYEKTLWPFAILTKKRYVGNLYGHNPDSYYQKSMGIVTKRRDNADIVKDVVGGIIDIILNLRDCIKAGKFVQEMLEKIIKGKFNTDKFIITKTLKPKEHYKKWETQPHVVLAERIKKRDPGAAPLPNERLPYIYIETGKKKIKLQGDRVEHPDYIKSNNIRIDYSFYITNQIMKPSIQFLDLILQPGISQKIFDDYLIIEENRKNNVKAIEYHLDNYTNKSDTNSDGLLISSDSYDSDASYKRRNKRNKSFVKTKPRDYRDNYFPSNRHNDYDDDDDFIINSDQDSDIDIDIDNKNKSNKLSEFIMKNAIEQIKKPIKKKKKKETTCSSTINNLKSFYDISNKNCNNSNSNNDSDFILDSD